MGIKPIVSVSYENERISIKKLTSHKTCVTSLLCGPWADRRFMAVLWVVL